MAAATMYVTVAGAGAKDGTTWANAFDLAAWILDMTNNLEPGDIYYIEDGTYTLTANFVPALDGTAALPIHLIGVKARTTNEPPVLSDWAIADADRPVIASGANAWQFDLYWQFRNLQKTGTTEWRADVGILWSNCKITNTNGGATNGIEMNSINCRAVDCDVQSTNGTGIQILGNTVGRSVIDCYIHDSSVKGIETSAGAAANFAVINTIIDTCGIGYEVNSQACILINSVIYNCTTGISDTGSFPNFTALNNSITSCTTGASWTANILDSFWDYNNWHGNTGDVTNVTKGLNATANAPEYTAAGSDFSIIEGGNMDGTGFGLKVGVGATASKQSQGAYEATISSGGGGGLLMANKRGNKQ